MIRKLTSFITAPGLLLAGFLVIPATSKAANAPL